MPFKLPAFLIIEMIHIPPHTKSNNAIKFYEQDNLGAASQGSNRSPSGYPSNDRDDYSSADDSDIDYLDSYHSHCMSGNNVEGNGDSDDDIECEQVS